MKNKTIYISGQITGLVPYQATKKFHQAHTYLIALDFLVVNPTILPHDHDQSWKSFMKEDLKAMKGCGHIYMLNNWEQSRGAKVELWFAKRYGLTVHYQPKF